MNEGFIRDAGQIGGYFECQVRKSGKGRVCGKRIHIPEDAKAATAMIQGYIDNRGYPIHCETTMTWVTRFEAKYGKKKVRQQHFDPEGGGGIEGRDGTVSGEA